MSRLRNILDKAMEHSPGVASKYAKRLLEPVYDRLSRTKLGRYFKGLSTPKKHTVEASMYIATEFLEPRLKGNTALGHVVREVILDAAPEIAKRMINGPDSEEQGSLFPEDIDKENQHEVIVMMADDVRKLRQKLRH